MAWEDIAPILNSVGVTQEQTETFFENNAPDPPAYTPPEITKQKVVAIAQVMFDGVHQNGIEHYPGGIARLAQDNKLTLGQARAIVDEIKRLFGLWKEQQE